MEQKTWLDFVNEKYLLQFFRDYNRRISVNVYDVESVKLVKDEKFGKILKVKSQMFLNKSLDIEFGSYEYTYFCSYGELKKGKKGFELIVPSCFEDINEVESTIGLVFPKFMNKLTKSVKINKKTYLEDYKEVIGAIIQKNFDKKLKNLKEEHEIYSSKLNDFAKEERILI